MLEIRETPSSFCLQAATRVPKTRIFVSPKTLLEIFRGIQ
jgi:hypothetical protein